VSLDNAEQISYWSGAGGAAWAASAARMDRELDRLGALALDALAPAGGSAVLDVGCGAGSTTIELARQVGPYGRALGVDVSGTLLGIARRRAAGCGLDNVHFVQADAQDMVVGRPFDALFSRFGVMFFAGPVAAFASLRRRTGPGGGLGFVCWQSLADNPWFGAASSAANAAAGVEPSLTDRAGPGAFAFADPGRLRQVLRESGWADVQLRPEVDELVLDEAAIEERVASVLQHGPAAAVLEAASAAVRERAARQVREALMAFRRDGAVRFRRAVWVVTARA
jgi:ubiquinone/menaquinone biosynthesis C-methylase UbiE